jgi:hypothetical protein
MLPYQTRDAKTGRPSSEDLMAEFLNQLVAETLALSGPSRIRRKWSAEYCQKAFPGSQEERKPDIALFPEDVPLDWHNVVSLAEIKKDGVDVDSLNWFDECARRANTVWGCQDARRFVVTMQLIGSKFSFMFFDRGGAVCPTVLDIQRDKEQFLRLVLYLSLGDPGACFKTW